MLIHFAHWWCGLLEYVYTVCYIQSKSIISKIFGWTLDMCNIQGVPIPHKNGFLSQIFNNEHLEYQLNRINSRPTFLICFGGLGTMDFKLVFFVWLCFCLLQLSSSTKTPCFIKFPPNALFGSTWDMTNTNFWSTQTCTKVIFHVF